ncbi:MAG: HrcA family transcriptional regulator, partial [bacterium]|nr:HrcA family transcriptional regulator [bacterium]
FSQPEFKDFDKMRSLLKILEEEEMVLRLIADDAKGPISVRIGAENTLAEVQGCSVVTASFTVTSGAVGHTSILGPTRMEYARVISLLNFVSKIISRV